MTSCAIFASNRISVEGVDLHDNGCGIMSVYTFPITLEDVSITANTGDGVNYISTVGNGRIKGQRVTVSGNGGTGLRSSGKITLEDAVVMGNGAGPGSSRRSSRSRCGTGHSPATAPGATSPRSGGPGWSTRRAITASTSGTAVRSASARSTEASRPGSRAA